LAEWEDIACLFDFAGGELPALDGSKHLFVFVSHIHSDHYDPAIFQLFGACPRRTFVLSSDVKPSAGEIKGQTVISMPPDRRRVIAGGSRGAMSVTTLRSTDCGVAFVVNYAGKTVYHAGTCTVGLAGRHPRGSGEMKNAFFDQLVKLKGLTLDAAFLPLDPRLGGNFWMALTR
jgi:L-ascorbate metabolism protein UlaG (beta-lactamase superfamily)